MSRWRIVELLHRSLQAPSVVRQERDGLQPRVERDAPACNLPRCLDVFEFDVWRQSTAVGFLDRRPVGREHISNDPI